MRRSRALLFLILCLSSWMGVLSCEKGQEASAPVPSITGLPPLEIPSNISISLEDVATGMPRMASLTKAVTGKTPLAESVSETERAQRHADAVLAMFATTRIARGSENVEHVGTTAGGLGLRLDFASFEFRDFLSRRLDDVDCSATCSGNTGEGPYCIRAYVEEKLVMEMKLLKPDLACLRMESANRETTVEQELIAATTHRLSAIVDQRDTNRRRLELFWSTTAPDARGVAIANGRAALSNVIDSVAEVIADGLTGKEITCAHSLVNLIDDGVNGQTFFKGCIADERVFAEASVESAGDIVPVEAGCYEVATSRVASGGGCTLLETERTTRTETRGERIAPAVEADTGTTTRKSATEDGRAAVSRETASEEDATRAAEAEAGAATTTREAAETAECSYPFSDDFSARELDRCWRQIMGGRCVREQFDDSTFFSVDQGRATFTLGKGPMTHQCFPVLSQPVELRGSFAVAISVADYNGDAESETVLMSLSPNQAQHYETRWTFLTERPYAGLIGFFSSYFNDRETIFEITPHRVSPLKMCISRNGRTIRSFFDSGSGWIEEQRAEVVEGNFAGPLQLSIGGFQANDTRDFSFSIDAVTFNTSSDECPEF